MIHVGCVMTESWAKICHALIQIGGYYFNFNEHYIKNKDGSN